MSDQPNDCELPPLTPLLTVTDLRRVVTEARSRAVSAAAEGISADYCRDLNLLADAADRILRWHWAQTDIHDQESP